VIQAPQRISVHFSSFLFELDTCAIVRVVLVGNYSSS
jgi:hypothetical protein